MENQTAHALFMYRAILNNLEQLDKYLPRDRVVHMGGELLWQDYFIHVYEGRETLNTCLERIRHDVNTPYPNCIKAYITEYGCPPLYHFI